MFFLSNAIKETISTAFYPGGVVTVRQLEEKDFEEIPLLRQVLCLCDHIRVEGKLKLTTNGYLPLKVVKDIYFKGITDRYFEKYPDKRIREEETSFVQIARGLALAAGIVRKTKNTLFITRKGEKILPDKQLLLESLLRTYIHDYKVSELDGYYEEFGLGFRDTGLSLVIFNMVRAQLAGNPMKGDYCADTYFSVFPGMYLDSDSERCYIFRTFSVFMVGFGLATTKNVVDHKTFHTTTFITPTPLYDKMIHISEEHNCLKINYTPDLKIYKLKTVLRDSNPAIWRRVQIPSTLLLSDLHAVLQHIMGWEDRHLHEFEKEEVVYTDYVDEELASIQETIHYAGMKVADLMNEKGDCISYRYDFGDNWELNILLEEVIDPEKNSEYPIFINGERKNPPEDCGGLYGFYQMLDILNDPDDPEREEYITWLRGDFNPEEIDNHPSPIKFKVLPTLN